MFQVDMQMLLSFFTELKNIFFIEKRIVFLKIHNFALKNYYYAPRISVFTIVK